MPGRETPLHTAYTRGTARTLAELGTARRLPVGSCAQKGCPEALGDCLPAPRTSPTLGQHDSNPLTL